MICCFCLLHLHFKGTVENWRGLRLLAEGCCEKWRTFTGGREVREGGKEGGSEQTTWNLR